MDGVHEVEDLVADNNEWLSNMQMNGMLRATMHMQQAMKHRKTLEHVWNDLDTFDAHEYREVSQRVTIHIYIICIEGNLAIWGQNLLYFLRLREYEDTRIRYLH